WTHMLASGTIGEDKRARALETIQRNAEAQAQLIEDLLDISRIITGKMRLQMGRVAFPQMIDGAIEAIRPAASAKQIEITREIDPQIEWVIGDGDRLQQIAWNLLSNAVKFTPMNGRVGVKATQLGDEVEIIVEDTGCGIPPAFLPHIFERFRQADG